MSLFQVKDWDVPSEAVGPATSNPKKRKRPTKNTESVRPAEVKQNIDKLMRMVEKGSLKPNNEPKKKRKGRNSAKDHDKASKDGLHLVPSKAKKDRMDNVRKETWPKGSKDVKKSQISNKPESGTSHESSGPIIDGAKSNQRTGRNSKKTTEHSTGLTLLQGNMKGSLEGARFRWINEVLYTTDSIEGYKLMREDPKAFEEYHKGFRQQVCSWPSNPVHHYISVLSSYPRGTVIVDLGCGEAALARALVPKGYCVLSYDLVSDGAYVLEADVCDKIALPGAEDTKGGDQGQIVDVCVCALSLMSLDWIRCIREAHRVLKLGGELKIAEVASRFTDLDQFIEVIRSLGFRLKSKDESNTHFTLFEFHKVGRSLLTTGEWEILRGKHAILKPCEYKRR